MTDNEPICRYRYDLDALARHASAVVAALPPRCRMFYAMKANSAPPLLRTLAPIVAGFEVASGGELAKASAAGARETLFGGPAKTPAEISQSLRQGVSRLHAESVLELHRISDAALRTGRTARVLLRVNLSAGFPPATLAMAGRPTQFGIEEARLGEAVRTVIELPGIRFAGFHLHSLSNNLSAAAHLELLELYRRKICGWEAEFGLRCEAVDVGGGIGVNYADDGEVFDWTAFTKGLAELVRTFPAHWKEIDFECGRFLVADCGSYFTEVLDVKRNHGVNYVLVRGGTHHFRLPASWQHSHPFVVHPVDRWPTRLPRPELTGEAVTVVGELCTPKDVLARDVVVDRVRAGDVLEFRLAGAYGWDISHHDFLSHPHPEQLFHSRESPAPARESPAPDTSPPRRQ
ncbi:diaminopimelate decarboxylase [Saccharomonospora amisosensis]|uniref:Diaminopimelate decarboxylase n=1 Tax=Saccharomonospora amisosensis TaxID=1128677 RepID=A0A7X5UM43_9PSEU|nr:type III PLP-dependent enzyme [Saccharomonospora amisosensis]NIJ10199.1 diaminopimelate decarboxylase [Saccharomonospora amisosensis]